MNILVDIPMTQRITLLRTIKVSTHLTVHGYAKQMIQS